MLICPEYYLIDKIFLDGFRSNGCEVVLHNYRNDNSDFFERINSNKSRFPYCIRSKWEKYYLKIINEKHLSEFYRINPDLVMIYNNEMLLPGTLNKFKKNSKVFLFLGDNPFYSQSTNKHNLTLISLADKVFSPDTYWIGQLEQLGFTNIYYFVSSVSERAEHESETTNNRKIKYASDIVYIGRNYPHSWGYKRTLFLSKFADFDLKIYGDKSWDQWLELFPELQEKILKHHKRLSNDNVRQIMISSRIYPVDSNPGIFNGLHLRIFECIENGILPVVEYRKDIELVFKDIEIPVVYNYNECKSVAKKFLEDDNKRLSVLKGLKEHVVKRYSPGKSVAGILNHM